MTIFTFLQASTLNDSLPIPPQLATQGEGGTTVHTVQGMDGQTENMTVDLSEAGLGQENQLIITGEDGHGYPVSVSGMITVPMSSMYQMVANIQHLHQNGDGTVCLTPIQVSNGGGSMAPNTKYHMLRAVAAPMNPIKYDMQQGGGSGAAVGGHGLLQGTKVGGSGSSPSGATATTGHGHQMSTGLASLIDVIQLQIKNEENDCNNNGRGEGDDEDGTDSGGGGGGGEMSPQRPKIEFVSVGEGPKRIAVQLKQK